MDSMTLREKIGQLFMVAAYSNGDDDHVEEISNLVSEYNVGGLIFFQGGPKRQAKLTNHYQSIAKTPLMIGMDAEWGLGMRLDSTLTYPRQMSLGGIQNDELIYYMGAEIGRQLRRLGVHVNFAPVLDVNNNPDNPVIGSRSFGEDKWSVARKGFFYMKGLQDNNVISVGKHFPGHGDTDVDSHYDLPVIMHSRERLDSIELFPFRHLINNGIGGMMTAHIHMPLLDATPDMASTLSPKIINELLINQMGFSGLVFTDALNMKGVSDYFAPGTLELMSLVAGNDMLVFPEDVPKAVDMIGNEVKKGNFPKEEIKRRCRKILKAKYWLDLDKPQKVEVDNLYEDLNGPDSYLLKQELIEESLVLVKNPDSLIPFKRLDTLNFASVAIGSEEKNEFQKTLSLYAPVDHFNIEKDACPKEWDALARMLEEYNMVVAGLHSTNRNVEENFGVTCQVYEFVKNISRKNNVVLTVFGSPYILNCLDGLNELSSLVVAYEDDKKYCNFAGQMLFGGIGSKGSLPVNSGGFKIGTGYISPRQTRLKYSVPEEAGMDSEKLQEIDSIIAEMIETGAAPGAQVFVARKGMVVYNKAFGNHTYYPERAVKNTDLYDLASVTKIAGTLPVLMKLAGEGEIDISNTLGHYLPFLEGTNKEGLVLRDVLTHQAGLKPWIPFHFSFFESYIPGEETFSSSFSEEFPYRLAAGYYLNRNYKLADNVFSRLPSRDFTIPVAGGMYMNNAYRDTIYSQIEESEVSGRKEYNYSDLGYYYIKDIVEKVSGTPVEMYLQEHFYDRLGAGRLTYLPRRKFGAHKIVPTENDVIFRRQLLDGYVHDQGAALLGGVAGHAGLFSNANDLGKLMQMFLQKGEYGGDRFISSEVVDYFTSAHEIENNNRRGVGFDKPEPDPSANGPSAGDASPKSYGHSGFTGTIAWVDPKEELVYIFLSNRIHPDQHNNKLIEADIRTRIQQVVYDAILSD